MGIRKSLPHRPTALNNRARSNDALRLSKHRQTLQLRERQPQLLLPALVSAMKCKVADEEQFRRVFKRRESYIPSAISQALVLYQHPHAFFDLVEEHKVPKILEDVAYILEEWSSEIGDSGLRQVELCGNPQTRVTNVHRFLSYDLEAILGNGNLTFIYHTASRRNAEKITTICSTRTTKPRIITPKKTGPHDLGTVFPWELNLLEYGYLEFKKDKEEQYSMPDGKKLRIEGTLSMGLSLLRFRHKNEAHSQKAETE